MTQGRSYVKGVMSVAAAAALSKNWEQGSPLVHCDAWQKSELKKKGGIYDGVLPLKTEIPDTTLSAAFKGNGLSSSNRFDSQNHVVCLSG